MDLTKLTIRQAHNSLLKKEFSTEELIRGYLKRIKELNEKLNVFLDVYEEKSLEQARVIDKKIAQGGEINLLEGIPLAIKDNILVGGEKTTAGSKTLENYLAFDDAVVVKKLKEEGAIILGKTNLDEFAMGSSTETSYFGPTRNPLDLERVAGGSSGGSAAAVAASMALASLGSDTGGSIRQPASFCGVVGFKPSYGRVSRYGLIAMASSLDQIGPLAKTVEDIEIIYQVIKGGKGKDSTVVEIEDKSSFNEENIVIGLPEEFLKETDKKVVEEIEKVVGLLESKGIKVERISLPYLKYALACYHLIMPAEASANLSRYDGIRFGFNSSQGETLWQKYAFNRGQGFGLEVKRRIILGTFVLSSGYYDKYYLQAQKVRRLIAQDFSSAFKKVDFILGPTTPTPAFKIGEKISDPLTMYLSDIFTVPANLAGLPAISLPCGKIGNLPIGCQIIGKQFQEKELLEISKLIEKEIKEKIG